MTADPPARETPLVDGFDPSQGEAATAPVETRSDAAQRALAEAKARRDELDAWATSREAEKGGRGGKDPVRYGDWEVKGLACDF